MDRQGRNPFASSLGDDGMLLRAYHNTDITGKLFG